MMMRPFLVRCHRCASTLQQSGSTFGAAVLAVAPMPETLSVATSRLFVLVKEGRPSLHASATRFLRMLLLPLVCLLR